VTEPVSPTDPRAAEARPDLAAGILTFLFTDIQGSTRMLQELGNAYGPLLAEHNELLKQAATTHEGRLIGSEGDAVFVAFADATSAIAAAVDAQRALAAHAWPEGHPVKVRMGIHSGEVQRVGNEYVGLALHQTARITAAGHGGQVLLSNTARDLASRSLPAGVTLQDLGLHRLKDLAEPERIFQLRDEQLPGTFPALRSLDARPNNLPVQLTTFVGRAELEVARGLLGSTHLLTLTGPGGTGKTRLALQLAAELMEDFPDGVFFVPLDVVTDPEMVASAIVSALGLEAGTQPPIDRLLAWGRNLTALLVLDNFEQVVDGATIVSRLLQELPKLRIVVTSRIPLHAYGEQEFSVPPLGLPSADDANDLAAVARSEAVRLFVERSTAVQPSFRLTSENAADVAEIVRRLDGLPLAIELAAARVRLLPVAAIRSRLDERLTLLVGGPRDRPSRQQTLRGAIDWSYDLLDQPDRRLLERFGVFAGGALFSSTETVCGPASDLGRDLLESVDSLVDKSLMRSLPIVSDEPRLAMLGVIREYALERLEGSSDGPAVRRRHAECYRDLAEIAQDKLTGPESRRWLDALEQDHDNLRAAIDWAVAQGEAEIALRMGAALWRFWQIRGHLAEARVRLDRILAMPDSDGAPRAALSRAEGAAGSIAYWRNDTKETHRHYKLALEHARQVDHRPLLAESLYNYGFAADPDLTDWSLAAAVGAPFMEEALGLYRDLGDLRGQASALWGLSTSSIVHRDYDAAIAQLNEGLKLYEQIGDGFGSGWSHHMLGLIEITRKNLDPARRHFGQALRIFQQNQDRSGGVLMLADFSVLARATGDMYRNYRLAGATDALRKLTGADLVLTQIDGIDWNLAEGPPEAAADAAAWRDGEGLSFEDALAYALEADPSD
jgi:predicted ATPase/class 3 adenylate cyclase